MAHTVPSDISRMALAGAHSPEMETLALLKKRLPNDYTGFHDVHWSREYRGGASFGEIDFVVVNRSGDVLFIEQKDGVLTEVDAFQRLKRQLAAYRVVFGQPRQEELITLLEKTEMDSEDLGR